MKALRRFAFVVVFVGLLYAGWRFADGNSTMVDVDYVLGHSGDVALWKALLYSTVAGVVVTFFLMIFWLIAARLEARRFRKEVVGLESELEQLRPAPAMLDGAEGGGSGSIGDSGREVVRKD